MTQLRSTDQKQQHENRNKYSKIIKQKKTNEKEFKSVLIVMSHEREKKEKERERERKNSQ